VYSAIQVFSGPIVVVDVMNTSKSRKVIRHRMQCTVSLVIWQADVWLRAMEIEIQYNLWPKWPGRTSLTLVPVVRQLLVFMHICYGIHSLRHTHTTILWPLYRSTCASCPLLMVKNSKMLEQSFALHMPVLTASSTFRLGGRR